jgi:hypothetical protein
MQKEAVISEVMGAGFVRSALIWRRRLFDWEEGLVDQLENLLRNATLSLDCDKWVWSLEDDGVFSVKSAYNHLALGLNILPPLPALEASVFRIIWSSPAPSKIIAFSWQLLYNWLPSKMNLSSRGVGIVLENLNCGWCVSSHETDIHLLLHCSFAQAVWREVCNWLNLNIIIPPNLYILFLCFVGGAAGKRERKGFLLVWHTTLWFLWKTRNGLIFKNVFKIPKQVVDEIMVTSWRWSVHRLNIAPCLLYEWQRHLRYCLRS